MSNENNIIPVTNQIRKYLKRQKEQIDIYELLKKLNLSEENYKIHKKSNEIIIKNKKETYDKEKVNKKLEFLTETARKLGKSKVWIYQEMVLSGEGSSIEEDTDIYQIAKLANEDVSTMLKEASEQEVIWFEDNCVLQGHLYEEMLSLQKNKN